MTVCVSGGFDPVHIGHIRLFAGAAKYGDLIVILNNDNWLLDKKGYVFMPQDERAEVLAAIKYVSSVYITTHARGDEASVCKALQFIKPQFFVNGGDRDDTIPEYMLCKRLGIRMLFGIGGEKVQSSSALAGGLK